MHVRKSLAVATYALASMLVLVALSILSTAQGVVFREIGSFEQQSPAPESIYCQWFIYDDDLVPYLVEVSVDIESESGMQKDVIHKFGEEEVDFAIPQTAVLMRQSSK